MPATEHCDVAIVGGGLAGGLIAFALAERRPQLTIRLIEAGAIGGNHTWSFFSDDIAPVDRWLVEPFVSHAWNSYDVMFPALSRTLGMRYNSIRSEDFGTILQGRLPTGTIVPARALALSPSAVVLADGGRIIAGGVIDARGSGDLALLKPGWQKFVGRELRLTAPHGLERPVVMDATVAQVDGFRFVYLLPFAPDRLLVEDTYYSDVPTLDTAAIGARIDAYVADRGWQVATIEREEAGVLPVSMGGDFARYWQSTGAGGKVGMRAGLFHPMTGYSLPDAVRTAGLIAAAPDLAAPALERLLHHHAAASWRGRGFYRLLGRMLFLAADPPHRYRVIERFYRLDAALIRRFYAARSTLRDKARILTGKPPVPIGRALRVLRERT